MQFDSPMTNCFHSEKLPKLKKCVTPFGDYAPKTQTPIVATQT